MAITATQTSTDADSNAYYACDGLNPDQPTGHVVAIPPDAVANRRATHDLASDADAVVWLLREQYARLNPGVGDVDTVSITVS